MTAADLLVALLLVTVPTTHFVATPVLDRVEARQRPK